MTTPGESSPSDHVLLERLRQGDETALASLIRRYATVMTVTAYGVLGSYDRTDDVVQTVFVRLWRRRTELQETGSLAAYLKHAAYNEALTQRRSESRQARRIERAVEAETLVPRAMSDAYTQVSHEELARIVRTAIEDLPGRMGEIFRLWWTGEYSYADIASLMGISVKGVEQARARAIVILRKNLEGYWP